MLLNATVTPALQAEWRVAKLNDLVKQCGGQWLSRLLSVCSIGGVTAVLTGEIAAGLKHQYHTKLTIKCYGHFSSYFDC